MRTILAGLALALAATPAAAEEWYLLGSGDAGIMYGDAHSVRKVGDITHVNVFMGLAAPLGDAEDLWYYISKFELRCEAEQLRSAHVEAYYEDHSFAFAEGEEVEWIVIQSGTFAEFTWQFACHGERGEAIANPFEDADDFFFEEY